jgi:hypothetical protein
VLLCPWLLRALLLLQPLPRPLLLLLQALLLARPLVLQQLVVLLPVPPQLVQLQRLVLLLLLVLHVWGRWRADEVLHSEQCSNVLEGQQVGGGKLARG